MARLNLAVHLSLEASATCGFSLTEDGKSEGAGADVSPAIEEMGAGTTGRAITPAEHAGAGGS